MKNLPILIFLFAVLLSGCSQELPFKEPGSTPVSIYISQEKNLSYSSSGKSTFKYKAVPAEPNNAVGTESEWKELTVYNNNGDLGYLSQGNWTITVREFKEGNAIAEGSENCYIAGSANYVINIVLKPVASSTDGSVSIVVDCPNLNLGEYKLVCNYKEISSSDFTTVDDFDLAISSLKNKYQTSLSLKPGSYIFNFTYYLNGIQISGETICADITDSQNQRIYGEIGSVVFCEYDFIINKDPSSESLEKDSLYTFVWQSDCSAETYKWYVDDVIQNGCTTPFFTFTPTEAKSYSIKCEISNGESAIFTAAVNSSAVSVTITFDDLVKLMENTDVVCCGFKEKGSSSMITQYPYTATGVSNTTSPSLSDLNLEPVIVTSTSQLISCSTLIVGKNYVSSADQKTIYNVFGLGLKETNSSVKIVYFFQNPQQRCLFGMTGVETIYIMGSVDTIESKAFDSLSSVKTISIANGVNTIRELAFQKCTGITSIFIPESVTTVEKRIFSNCSSLKTITTGYGYVNRPSGWASNWLEYCTTASNPFKN